MRVFISKTVTNFFIVASLLGYSSAYGLNIVTTIKPLHSIVSSISMHIHEPVLLIQKQTSAHHYQLTPNDKLTIAKADQVFWFGSDIETAFTGTFNKQKSMSMLSIANLRKHKIRETHAHHKHEHHSENKDDEELDPHIWLDTNNAVAIANAVAAKLSMLDKENAAQYAINAKTFATQIKALQNELWNQYAQVKDQPFASLHDAFQYTEKQFNLNHVGNISLHPTLPLSGKQRLQINNTIKTKKIQCIFYDPAHHPKAAQQLTNQQQIRLQALDPIGYKLDKGKALYFDLLRNLARDITGCLNP